MAPKPQDLFVGVIGLFVIVIPGAIAIFVALALAYGYPFEPLPTLYWGSAEARAAFLVGSYFAGHVTSLVGSGVEDGIYKMLGAVGRKEHPELKAKVQELAPTRLPGVTDATLRRRAATFVRSKSERDAVRLDRKDADRRFFRNLTIVFLSALVAGLAMWRLDWILGSTALTALCLWRYLDQQSKYTRDVYEFFLTETWRA